MPEIKLNLTEEQIEELKKQFPEQFEEEWPKEGDKYYAINNTGTISLFIFNDDHKDYYRLKMGNFFRGNNKGLEECKMNALRIESQSWNEVTCDEDCNKFWYWCFDANEPDSCLNDYYHRETYLQQTKFKTKERCQEWGDKFAKAWEYLYK